MPGESLSENHAGRVAITANKCEREGKPCVRRAGVRGHETHLRACRVPIICRTGNWRSSLAISLMRRWLISLRSTERFLSPFQQQPQAKLRPSHPDLERLSELRDFRTWRENSPFCRRK